jgi:hypothetical protein
LGLNIDINQRNGDCGMVSKFHHSLMKINGSLLVHNFMVFRSVRGEVLRSAEMTAIRELCLLQFIFRLILSSSIEEAIGNWHWRAMSWKGDLSLNC